MKAHALAASLAAVLLVSSIAAAGNDGPPKNEEAQRLFEEARSLADNGKWAEACPRLASSFKLEPNMTTEFRLADCYERIGKYASAYVHYKGAAEAAGTAGETPKQKYALERAAKLEPAVDKIVIVPPDEPDVRVERDGKTVPQAQWKQPVPIDPGEHTVHVWAPGKASYDTLVTVSGRGATIRIDVPALEDPIPWRLAPGAQVTSIAERPSYRAPREEPPRSKPYASLRPWGYGMGILGLAAVGGGIALYANAASSENDSTCGDGRCVPAVSLMSAGAVVLLFGAVLVVLGNSD